MTLTLMALALLALLRLTPAFLTSRRLAAWETAWSTVGLGGPEARHDPGRRQMPTRGGHPIIPRPYHPVRSDWRPGRHVRVLLKPSRDRRFRCRIGGRDPYLAGRIPGDPII
jgi:hypothetical protein